MVFPGEGTGTRRQLQRKGFTAWLRQQTPSGDASRLCKHLLPQNPLPCRDRAVAAGGEPRAPQLQGQTPPDTWWALTPGMAGTWTGP